MGRSFSFSILQATPDRRRGEQVNIGLVVFKSDGLDVKLPESRKLISLTGRSGEDLTRAFVEQIRQSFTADLPPNKLIESIGFYSQVFKVSDPGQFIVESETDYETRVRDILHTLVIRPQIEKPDRQQPKINKEIKQDLVQSDVMAKRNDTIESHRVVANFVVSEEREAVADFAYKNGSLRIVSTLDLRGLSVEIKRPEWILVAVLKNLHCILHAVHTCSVRPFATGQAACALIECACD